MTSFPSSTQSFPSHSQPFHSFLAGFIRGNYFYLASAILMMLACKLLMRSPAVDVPEFKQTFQTLLILQGYEVLLILTAFLIVRRLRIIGDAFTLFAIEIVLLADPTFFSNSFHTMYVNTWSYTQSLGVNLLCFGLAPIKLLILAKLLGIRLRPAAWGTFIFALAAVYLAEFPLTMKDDVYVPMYYYGYAWAPFLVALCAPALAHTAAPASEKERLYTPRQIYWLPRLLIIVPLLFVAAHYVESSWVHDVHFRPLHVAPLLLVFVPFIIKNAPRAQRHGHRLAGIDCLAGVALLMTLPGANSFSFSGSKEYLLLDKTSVVVNDPSFITSPCPIAIASFFVIFSYFYFWKKLGDRRALNRPAIIATAGLLYGLYRIGIIAEGKDIASNLWHVLFAWVQAHATLIGIAVLAALAAIAAKFQNALTWITAGLMGIIVLFDLLPHYSSTRVPEAISAVFFLLMIVYLRFGTRRDALVSAVVTAAIVVSRYVFIQETWAGLVVLGTVAAFAAIAIMFESRGFGILAALEGAVFLAFASRSLWQILEPAVMILLGALLLFSLGVLVTFYKEQLLVWASKYEHPHTFPATGAPEASAPTKSNSGCDVDESDEEPPS